LSPDKKPTKPVDIYVRVSRVGGREGVSFQSPEQQEERCRAQLKADGLQVGEIFIDLDESGAKVSRPAFDKAMARIESGESGGVIVYDLSRFGRNTRHVLDGGVDFIESHDAAFITCAEKFDTSTATGRFVLTLFAALRELEREQSREPMGSLEGEGSGARRPHRCCARGLRPAGGWHVGRAPRLHRDDQAGILAPRSRWLVEGDGGSAHGSVRPDLEVERDGEALDAAGNPQRDREQGVSQGRGRADPSLAVGEGATEEGRGAHAG
jgi:hypothetical protein